MQTLDEMTISGHHMAMKKARIAELKAHLSHYVALARGGETIQICERDTPVALLVPLPAERPVLRSRRPAAGARPWYQVEVPPLPEAVAERLMAEFLAERKLER